MEMMNRIIGQGASRFFPLLSHSVVFLTRSTTINPPANPLTLTPLLSTTTIIPLSLSLRIQHASSSSCITPGSSYHCAAPPYNLAASHYLIRPSVPPTSAHRQTLPTSPRFPSHPLPRAPAIPFRLRHPHRPLGIVRRHRHISHHTSTITPITNPRLHLGSCSASPTQIYQ